MFFKTTRTISNISEHIIQIGNKMAYINNPSNYNNKILITQEIVQVKVLLKEIQSLFAQNNKIEIATHLYYYRGYGINLTDFLALIKCQLENVESNI